MTAVERIADWLRRARVAAVFTGAGISTESGIPDFRSPGGIWSKSNPVLFQDYLRSEDARYEAWRQKSITHAEFSAAQPNTGHRVLAKWERDQRIAGVITQNIDGLHQLAGSKSVLELHGTARRVVCLVCKTRFDSNDMIQQFLQDDRVPKCPQCNGLVKHATVSFGQVLPEDVLDDAVQLSGTCDLFFAIGSSLVVEPAASLPRLAMRSNARLVILNRDETSLDNCADVVIREPISQTLTAIDKMLST